MVGGDFSRGGPLALPLSRRSGANLWLVEIFRGAVPSRSPFPEGQVPIYGWWRFFEGRSPRAPPFPKVRCQFMVGGDFSRGGPLALPLAQALCKGPRTTGAPAA